MANSKYAYVKSFEVDDSIAPPNIIIVRIEARDFRRFADAHGIKRPYDENALNLMNACAVSVVEEYPDIVFACGINAEYSFVLKKKTKFYQRRSSKILSVVTSFFTSVYSTKWKEFFPNTELHYPISFHGRIVVCATIDVLQQYFAWRQHECYVTNLYDTCAWKLVAHGKTEAEVLETLKGTQKQEKHELLRQFQTNYNNLPELFRWGSSHFLIEVEKIVKYSEDGSPVRRSQKEIKTFQPENISRRIFWNQQPSLVTELGAFTLDVDRINPDFVASFHLENKLMPSTWIVIRIDGRHFHNFSKVHEFKKPNDEQALKLMNLCAVKLLEEFQDIVFAYGHSDEYSFVLKKNSQFCKRKASNIVSTVASFFSSTYVMKWKAYFPQKELICPPSFDGRAICYPAREILHDYLSWRQVDCHINNQYNTCFWMLAKSGNRLSEAQRILKGTCTQQKMELLSKNFGIDYKALKDIFRLGSSVFRETPDNETSGESLQSKVVVEHCNIIDQSFWEAHPSIFGGL